MLGQVSYATDKRPVPGSLALFARGRRAGSSVSLSCAPGQALENIAPCLDIAPSLSNRELALFMCALLCCRGMPRARGRPATRPNKNGGPKVLRRQAWGFNYPPAPAAPDAIKAAAAPRHPLCPSPRSPPRPPRPRRPRPRVLRGSPSSARSCPSRQRCRECRRSCRTPTRGTGPA